MKRLKHSGRDEDSDRSAMLLQLCSYVRAHARLLALGVAVVLATAAAGPILAWSDLAVRNLKTRALVWMGTPEILLLQRERFANTAAFAEEQAGNAAASAGDPEGAITHFTRAIELYGTDHPTAAHAYRLRAREFEALKKYPQALADADKAIALEPDYIGGYHERAELLAQLGRTSDALAEFSTAIRRQPDDAKGYLLRGDLLAKLERRDEAIADYTQALAAVARDNDARSSRDQDEASAKFLHKYNDELMARARVHRGETYQDLGRFDAALADFTEALLRRPNYRYGYISRGWLYEKQGFRELARLDYEEAARLGKPSEWLTRALERAR